MTNTLIFSISGLTTLQQQEQQTQELLVLIIVILVSALSLLAISVALRALFPRAVALSQQFLEQSPWRAFFIGLVNYIFLGGIVIAISATGIEPLNLIAVLIIAVVLIFTAFGLSGLAQLTGQRLADMRDKPLTPFAENIGGLTTLLLSSLLPFVGWFLIAPVMLLISFGAAMLGWRNRKKTDSFME